MCVFVCVCSLAGTGFCLLGCLAWPPAAGAYRGCPGAMQRAENRSIGGRGVLLTPWRSRALGGMFLRIMCTRSTSYFVRLYIHHISLLIITPL